VHRRGYRFVAPVTRLDVSPGSAATARDPSGPPLSHSPYASPAHSSTPRLPGSPATAGRTGGGADAAPAVVDPGAPGNQPAPARGDIPARGGADTRAPLTRRAAGLADAWALCGVAVGLPE
jgi:hypothetical protein